MNIKTTAISALMAAMQFDARSTVFANPNVIRDHNRIIKVHANDNDVRKKSGI